MRIVLFTVLAIIAPPILVGLYRGFGWHVLLNLLLFFVLPWIGAVVHSVLLLMLTRERIRVPADVLQWAHGRPFPRSAAC